MARDIQAPPSLVSETPKKRDYLSMIDIFQDLSHQEMDRLMHMTAMSTAKRGRIFYTPDEPAEVLFILKRGTVAISRIAPSGKKLIVSTLGPGTIFGEMAVVGQRLQQSYAEALTDCLICVMSRRDVEELLLADPRVAVRLVGILGERLAQTEARLEDMAFKALPARLASLLLRLALERDRRGRPVLAGLTHEQLAELTGVYRETVTASLNDLKARGLIELGRRKITILDPAGLRSVGSGMVEA